MRHLFKALAHSWGGFLVLLGEAAFRQELVMLLAALSAVCWRRGFSALGAALPWGLLVLITEALNTGIEKTVDLCTQEWHPLAKAAVTGPVATDAPFEIDGNFYTAQEEHAIPAMIRQVVEALK